MQAELLRLQKENAALQDKLKDLQSDPKSSASKMER